MSGGVVVEHDESVQRYGLLWRGERVLESRPRDLLSVGNRWMASKFVSRAVEIRGGMRLDQMSRIPAQRLSVSDPVQFST